MKLHVVFDKNGEKVGDCDAYDFAISKVDRIKGTEQEMEIRIANHIVILAFRLLVKEGKIDHKDILFYDKTTDPYLELSVDVNEDGKSRSRLEGDSNTYSDILTKLL